MLPENERQLSIGAVPIDARKKTRKSANLGDYHADLMLKKLSKISDLMSAEMA